MTASSLASTGLPVNMWTSGRVRLAHRGTWGRPPEAARGWGSCGTLGGNHTAACAAAALWTGGIDSANEAFKAFVTAFAHTTQCMHILYHADQHADELVSKHSGAFSYVGDGDPPRIRWRAQRSNEGRENAPEWPNKICYCRIKYACTAHSGLSKTFHGSAI